VTIVTQYVGGGGGYSSPPSASYGKPDTTAPVILFASTTEVGAFSVGVKVETDEDAVTFIDYGETIDYGFTEGDSGVLRSKVIKLKKLQTGTLYHYRIKLMDKSGNFTTTEDRTFSTLFLSELLSDRSFLDKATDIQGKLEQLIESALPSLSPPFLSTPTIVNITESGATLSWTTNIKTYGSLNYATEEDYKTNNGIYTINVPSSPDKLALHSIDLASLKPNTKYHIQATSYVFPQVLGKTPDITFTTKAPSIQGSIVERKTDSFRAIWTSRSPSSSIVDYKNMTTGESNRKVIREQTTSHDVSITHLIPGTTYEVAISGMTSQGNLLEAQYPFTVTMDVHKTPPKIALIKVNSALVSGRTDRAQTVISWNTDEPATSLVTYEEGSGATDKELANKIAEKTDNFTTSHAVIIPSLKVGTIYRIQVTSTDEAGNVTKLPVRSIITPRNSESVVDVIFKNFEDTFKVFRQGQ
jgi:hypothetical protein